MTPREMRSIRVSPEAMERLRTLAEQQERTVSDVMRRCLARGLVAEEADLKAAARRTR